MVGDATAFHTLVCNIGVEFLKGELGGLLGYVFFHKDGEFGGGIGGEGHGRGGVVGRRSNGEVYSNRTYYKKTTESS